jgi:catechol 2,3-dioxygenase-like lactoylglutathione lyase family enzyme
MFGKIDHLGHVVKDFDKAMDLYKNKFGLTPKRVMEFPEFGSRMAFFPFGDIELEVIKPGGGGDDPAARCLKERGEGIFHISIKIDSQENYDKEMKKWRDNGFTVNEYTHSKEGHMVKLAFLSPSETMGLWIEFIFGD